MKRGFWSTVDDVLNKADIIIEVVDARFPIESRNFDIERMVREKGRRLIIAFTKSDLIDTKTFNEPKDCKHWILLSAKRHRRIGVLKQMLKELSPKKEGKPKVGVVGYPNMGKSALINALKGKDVVRVSSQPGFTRGAQFVSTTNYMLIDTPGVIPRNERDDLKHIKMVSTSLDERDPELAVWGLMETFPGLIEKYFGVEVQEDKEFVLDEIALKKNWLKKGGQPDTMRTAKQILMLWQQAKISPRKSG